MRVMVHERDWFSCGAIVFSHNISMTIISKSTIDMTLSTLLEQLCKSVSEFVLVEPGLLCGLVQPPVHRTSINDLDIPHAALTQPPVNS